MSQNKKKAAKFQYYTEDTDCIYCLYYKRRSGCTLTACCCDDVKRDAALHDRTKRERRWNK